VIVDFQALDRWKFARQNIEDLRIQSQGCEKNGDANDGQHSHTAPNQRATLCDGSGDEIADAHVKPPFNTNRREDANVRAERVEPARPRAAGYGPRAGRLQL
jgi:hypothetical protein